MRALPSVAVAAALVLAACGSAPPRAGAVPDNASAAAEPPANPVKTQAGPFTARLGRLDLEVSFASADALLRPQSPPKPGELATEGALASLQAGVGTAHPGGLVLGLMLMPVAAVIAEGFAGAERARAETIHEAFARHQHTNLVGEALEKRIASELEQEGPAQRLAVIIERYGLETWKDGKYCFVASGRARVERADGQAREAQFTLAPEGRPGLRRPYCGTVAEFAAADGAMLERALRESAEELGDWLAPSRRADDAGTRKLSKLRRWALVPIDVPLPQVCTGRERPWAVPENSLHGELAAKLLNEEKGYAARLVTSTVAADGQPLPERALRELVSGLRDYAGNDARFTPPPENVRQAVRRLASPANADGVLLVERARTCQRAIVAPPGSAAAPTPQEPVFTSYVRAAMFDATSGELLWMSVRTDVAVAVQGLPAFRDWAYRSPLEAKVAAEMRHLLGDVEPIRPQLLHTLTNAED